MPPRLDEQILYSLNIGNEIINVTGRKRTKHGYILLCIKNHPNSDGNGYIFEHRVMMEIYLGRFLKKDEIVHHLNEIKHDNRIENLKVMTTSDHTTFHNLGTKHTEHAKKLMAKKRKEMNLVKEKHPRYKKVDIKEMVILREKGLSYTEIGKKFGLHRRTVSLKIKEYLEEK